MSLLLFYVALALCVSFLCSILEASLLTITPAAVRSAEQKGAAWAPRMKVLKDDVERPLAAILTLNTVAHTMGAAGAGAQYAKLYGAGSEAVFAALLTVAILVVTEIIPKTIGARYSKNLAPFAARVLPALVTMMAPLVWIFRQLTQLLTRGKPPPRHREELLALASLGQLSGEIERSEVRVLRNLLQLCEVRASDIMTPRTVVFSAPLGRSAQDLAAKLATEPFTRVPVFGDGSDDITGFVIKHEVLAKAAADRDSNPEPLVRTLPEVLDEMRVDLLFRQMISQRQHIVAIRDEYGTFVGIVTLEDVLETILGFEIVDELDEVPDLQTYARDLAARRSAEVKGSTD